MAAEDARDNCNQDWNTFKERLLQFAPTIKDVDVLQYDLLSADRNKGETLTAFANRLNSIVLEIATLRPTLRTEVEQLAHKVFLKGLPPKVRSKFGTQPYIRDYLKELEEFVSLRPNFKLDHESIAKEKTYQSVATVEAKDGVKNTTKPKPRLEGNVTIQSTRGKGNLFRTQNSHNRGQGFFRGRTNGFRGRTQFRGMSNQGRPGFRSHRPYRPFSRRPSQGRNRNQYIRGMNYQIDKQGQGNFESHQNASELICYQCNKKGHIRPNCPQSSNLCYACNEPGHRAYNCPLNGLEGAVANISFGENDKKKTSMMVR